jgi:hypothetical protein
MYWPLCNLCSSFFWNKNLKIQNWFNDYQIYTFLNLLSFSKAQNRISFKTKEKQVIDYYRKVKLDADSIFKNKIIGYQCTKSKKPLHSVELIYWKTNKIVSCWSK